MTPSTSTPRRARRCCVAVVACAALSVAVGCTDEGGGGSPSDGFEVVGDGKQFNGRFAALPLHPRSEPVSELAVQDGTVTRSYVAEGASTELVMSFYEDSLPPLGWKVALEPRKSGSSTLQAEWVDDGLVLRITASDASGLGGDASPTDSVRTQYSLIMSEE